MFLRPKTAILEEQKLLGRAETPKKVKISHRELGNRREKDGVSICTHKKLVDVSRRLVQIIIVLLLVSRDLQLRFNEPKIATKKVPQGLKQQN